MNILSKQLLYKLQTPAVETYEAYYINNNSITLLGDVTDLSKTFAPQDEFIYSNVFVYNGDLYNNATRVTTGRNITSITGRTTSSSYLGFFVDDGKLYSFNSSMNITQIGSATNWINVCGYSSVSGDDRAFGETTNGLYILNSNDTVTQISTLTNWTKICGYGNTSSANYYGYGINDGKLYYLYANGNGAVQQGTDTTWTDITGSYENGSWFGYGINNGKLYQLSGTPTQVGSDTTWTKISGTSATRSSGGTAIGISGLNLYRITGTTAKRVGYERMPVNCSGFSTPAYHGLVYTNSTLYYFGYSGSTSNLMGGEWVYCGGTEGSNAYAVAIRRKQ